MVRLLFFARRSMLMLGTDFEDQGKMSLKTDIKYKSNWQNGTLKAQRRNKFICASESMFLTNLPMLPDSVRFQ